MAFYNVFRNKKKAVIVMFSLSLSMILLNSVYTIITGFDIKKYLSNYMVGDFQMADEAYFNEYTGYKNEDTLTEDIVSEISSLTGVTGTGRVYFEEINHKLTDKAERWFKASVPENLKKSNDHNINDDINTGEIKCYLFGLDEHQPQNCI